MRYSIFFACMAVTGLLLSFGLFCVSDRIKFKLDKGSKHKIGFSYPSKCASSSD